MTIIWDRESEIWIHDPRPLDFYRSQFYYDKAYNELLESGILSEIQSQAVLHEQGLWTEDKEKELKTFQDNLTKLNKQLPDLTYKSNDYKQTKIYIDITEKKIGQLLSDKNALMFKTAEYLANIERYKYLLFLLTFLPDGSRKWNDFDSFNKLDNNWLNDIILQSFFSKNLSDKSIRELARNEPWRSIWLGAVKTGNLFPFAKSEMTEYQRMLVMWSVVYDNVYESMDCPSDEVIHNDILLDQWFIANAEKRKQNKENSGPNIKNSKIANAQEVGIVVDSLEDAQKVYNLNREGTKADLIRNEKFIQKHGMVSAGNLPTDRKNLKILYNNANIKGIKDRHG